MSQSTPILSGPLEVAKRLWTVRIVALLGPIIFWASVARLTISVNGYFAPPDAWLKVRPTNGRSLASFLRSWPRACRTFMSSGA
jgi:hypothetical protein